MHLLSEGSKVYQLNCLLSIQILLVVSAIIDLLTVSLAIIAANFECFLELVRLSAKTLSFKKV